MLQGRHQQSHAGVVESREWIERAWRLPCLQPAACLITASPHFGLARPLARGQPPLFCKASPLPCTAGWSREQVRRTCRPVMHAGRVLSVSAARDAMRHACVWQHFVQLLIGAAAWHHCSARLPPPTFLGLHPMLCHPSPSTAWRSSWTVASGGYPSSPVCCR